MRIVATPEARSLRAQLRGLAHRRDAARHHPSRLRVTREGRVEGRQLHAQPGASPLHFRSHEDAFPSRLGQDPEPPDRALGNRFEPYALPDARDRGVEDEARAKRLLAASLATALAGIEDRDPQLVDRFTP